MGVQAPFCCFAQGYYGVRASKIKSQFQMVVIIGANCLKQKLPQCKKCGTVLPEG
jgi:hypothetical protein